MGLAEDVEDNTLGPSQMPDAKSAGSAGDEEEEEEEDDPKDRFQRFLAKSAGSAKDDKDDPEDSEEDEDEGAQMSQFQRYLAMMRLEDDNLTDVPRSALLDSFDLEGVAAYIQKNRPRIVVMAGAGISVSAGIPDFRTPGTGLYDNLQKYDLPDPQAVFDIKFFKQNPTPFYELAKEIMPSETIKPTRTHHFIRLLELKGLLLRCFTQNIDSLESAAGISKELIVAAHGNFDSAHCIETGVEVPIAEVTEAIRRGPYACMEMKDKYGGLVKPDIVFFGEGLPRRFFECMQRDLPEAGLLIVMGTSLVVQPFASLVSKVSDDTPRLLINREKVGERQDSKLARILHLMGMPSDAKGFAFGEGCYRDVFAQGECDESVLKLATLLGWQADLDALCTERSPH
jgi:NAD-dependent deacetylase sirtuin 2